MGKLLPSLGFRDNPFASYSAENEPDIDQYFVRPPYYDFVVERGHASRSLVLFGARGAGKSATRLTFFKEAWRETQAGREGPLVVTLDDFSRVLGDGVQKVDLGKYVAEVGYLVIEAILVWLAAHEDADRAIYLQGLTKQEEAAAVALVSRFYLSRPDFVRSASIREPLKLLNQAWHKRTALWIAKRWDAVATLVATTAQALVAKAASTDLKIEGGLSALLKTDTKDWSDAQFARAILLRLVDLAKQFGFAGITVLVDKADETTQTSNSSTSTAALLYPLLSNTQLLEVDGFAWLFFLWDKLRDEYATDTYPVRLDKIPNATIQWDAAFLRNLVDRRLDHFSDRKVKAFGQLCDDSVAADKALQDIMSNAMRSPRELIRVLDTVVREHDDEHSSKLEAPRLLPSSIERALDKYAVETARRLFDRMHLQRLAKLRMLTFINRDIQQAFRMNDQSARNRIRPWVDAGIVAQTGTRPAEGGSGGKPSHEYSVVDFRVRRILERNLSLGIDFDVTEDDEPNQDGG